MNRKYMPVLPVIASLVLGFTTIRSAQACSGGATDTIQSLLSRTQYVLKADVVAVDVVRQNAMMRAESYLFGGAGPEHLAFVQNDPVVVTRMTQGDPYGNCNFFKPELHAGLSAYFFLTRRPDGAYLSTTQWNEPTYYAFTDEAPTVRFYSQPEQTLIEHQLDEMAFVEFVTTVGASKVATPDPTIAYPRLAPLKITTNAGSTYILPLDTATPVPLTPDYLDQMTQAVLGPESTRWNERYLNAAVCLGAVCVGVSPNGIQRAVQRGGAGVPVRQHQ